MFLSPVVFGLLARLTDFDLVAVVFLELVAFLDSGLAVGILVFFEEIVLVFFVAGFFFAVIDNSLIIKFYLDNEKTINLKLVSFDKKSPLITIDEINNRTDIEKFVNKKIFLKKEQLSPVKGNEYYFHDLEGLEVFDNKDQRVGEVASVVNFGAGDLLEIYFIKSKKKEFFRFTEQNFPLVNIKEKKITIVISLMQQTVSWALII